MVTRDQIDKVATATPDTVSERSGALRALIPEAFTEGKIDFSKLREALGDDVDDRPERYSFSWAGKRDAIRLLQTPSQATLEPVPEESINWDTTENVFIEGDNLEVLKLLYKPYFGRVKMIYIDPPYNTGNDFIYPDDFAHPLDTYLAMTEQQDSQGNLLTSNPETSGRYHSSWLSMMYPRLFLARQLLNSNGVIFVSIDDHEVSDLRLMMNEIFGEENFIASIIWQKIFSPKNTARHFSVDHDYILVFARDAATWTPNPLPRTKEADARYSNPSNDERGSWTSSDLTARNYYSEGQYVVKSPSGKEFKPAVGTYWRVSYEKLLELDREGRIWWGTNGNNMPRLKRFLSDVQQGMVPQTLWLHDIVGNTQEAKKELLDFVHFENTDNVLDTVKPTRLLQRMLLLATSSSSEDIVLDFFAGSASLGHAVLKQNKADGGNRRFICVQIPEPLPIPEDGLKTLADISKQRLRNAIQREQREQSGRLDLSDEESSLDLGFRVYRLGRSNLRPWNHLPPDVNPSAYISQLEILGDPLVADWTMSDVVLEIAIREGLSLTSKVLEERMNDVPTWTVTDQDKGLHIRICLADTVTMDSVRALNLSKNETFICRDIALDDTVAANLALQCHLKTI